VRIQFNEVASIPPRFWDSTTNQDKLQSLRPNSLQVVLAITPEKMDKDFKYFLFRGFTRKIQPSMLNVERSFPKLYWSRQSEPR